MQFYVFILLYIEMLRKNICDSLLDYQILNIY